MKRIIIITLSLLITSTNAFSMHKGFHPQPKGDKLIQAIMQKNKIYVQFLVDICGANVNEPIKYFVQNGQKKYTFHLIPLFVAIELRAVSIVKYLLTKNISLEKHSFQFKDTRVETSPLEYAQNYLTMMKKQGKQLQNIQSFISMRPTCLKQGCGLCEHGKQTLNFLTQVEMGATNVNAPPVYDNAFIHFKNEIPEPDFNNPSFYLHPYNKNIQKEISRRIKRLCFKILAIKRIMVLIKETIKKRPPKLYTKGYLSKKHFLN